VRIDLHRYRRPEIVWNGLLDRAAVLEMATASFGWSMVTAALAVSHGVFAATSG